MNYGINATISVDKRSDGTIHRTLIQFDISSIPAGATIDSACIVLTGFSAGDVDSVVYIQRITKDWDEGTETEAAGDVSWNEAKSGDAWTLAGGDFDATIYGIINPLNSVTADTVGEALIQGWLDGTWSNYGMILRYKADTVTPSVTQQYSIRSSDYGTAAQRPKLSVYYTLSEDKGISYMRGWIVKGHMPNAKGLARSAWNSMMRTKKK